MTKYFILYILLLFSSLFCINAINGKCRALVLQGGGDMGSFEVGVITGLIQAHANNSEEIAWDVVSGVSAGAINAVSVALFAIGEEAAMIEYLNSTWIAFNASTFLTPWPGVNFFEAAFMEPGLFDTDGIRSFMTTNLGTKTPQRNFTIGTTNADIGAYMTFNNSNIQTSADLVEAVMCSTAMPMALPYQIFGGNTYMDGGTIKNLDVTSAIEICRDIVDDDADIIVDIVMCTAQPTEDVVANNYKAFNMLMRYLMIKEYSGTMTDLYHAFEDFPDVNFRYIVFPQAPLPDGEVPIGFVPSQLSEMWQIGVNDAYAAVNAGAYNQANFAKEKATKFMRTKRGPDFKSL